MNRRAFVRGTGALLAAVPGLVAGCVGSGEAPDDGGTPTEQPPPVRASGGPAPPAVREYLAGTSNFRGEVADRTGSDEAPVAVGARGNGGYYGFWPPAIRIDAGTTVAWEWSGKGGRHDVVAAEGATFASILTGERHTFSRTFDDPGVVTYYCTPHRSLGMKGAVVVVE